MKKILPAISHVEASCCNFLPKCILRLSHKNPRATCGVVGVPGGSRLSRCWCPLLRPSASPQELPSQTLNTALFSNTSTCKRYLPVIAVNKKVCLINKDCYFSHMFNTLKIDKQNVTHDVEIEQKHDSLTA